MQNLTNEAQLRVIVNHLRHVMVGGSVELTITADVIIVKYNGAVKYKQSIYDEASREAGCQMVITEMAIAGITRPLPANLLQADGQPLAGSNQTPLNEEDVIHSFNVIREALGLNAPPPAPVGVELPLVATGRRREEIIYDEQRMLSMMGGLKRIKSDNEQFLDSIYEAMDFLKFYTSLLTKPDGSEN